MDDFPFAAGDLVTLQSLSTATTTAPGGALSVGVGYLPAPGHTARVGGDWVDVVDVERAAYPNGAVRTAGSTAFMIGDVMGHGPHLAGRSQVARTVLARALRDSGPSAALHLLDVGWSAVTAWSDTMATACVVTATPFARPVAARLRSVAVAPPPAEPVTGWHLGWSSAGHPAPLVVTPDGVTTTLPHEHGDLPIGVDPSRPRHDHHAVVPDGCALLMFTDGVIERRRPSTLDGVAHLAALSATLGRDSLRDPAAAAGRLLAARAPHLDSGDESTLLLAHLAIDPHPQLASGRNAA